MTCITIEPGSLDGRDEKLRSVGVGSGVGHGQESGSGVPQFEVFVFEGAAVDGLAAGAVEVGEVSAL